MPRITEDPTGATCPSFDGPEWEFPRQSIIAGHQGDQPLTAVEAAQPMKEAWARENKRKVAAWNAQLEQDERDRLEPKPATYALNKLNSFEYVELDYFTMKGCAEAVVDTNKPINLDLAFTQLGDTFTLQQLAASWPSQHIRNDKDLSWEEMLSRQRRRALFHDQVRAVATSPFGVHRGEALMLYQSRVRREWFYALERDEGFNIALINEDLLRCLAEEVNDNIRDKVFDQTFKLQAFYLSTVAAAPIYRSRSTTPTLATQPYTPVVSRCLSISRARRRLPFSPSGAAWAHSSAGKVKMLAFVPRFLAPSLTGQLRRARELRKSSSEHVLMLAAAVTECDMTHDDSSAACAAR
ncbi:hypothetical protein EI94DRAFT_1833169 [Lactarius quietus]|nr:hypothetical protein EI94DRAFT_1833169 [Lactarius quietus]